jgi:aspartate dehydrogenase
VFEGSARAVVEAFPQNTNVAAALTLASGLSEGRTRIRVVADPTIRVNIHELEVEGDCGRIHCTIESRPSANPKTSELAVRSAVATLGRLFDSVLIGT